MFTIKKGSSRIVILIPFFGIAIKFPIIYPRAFFKSLYRVCFGDFSKKAELRRYFVKLICNMRDTDEQFSGGWYLFRGISDNWTEFLFLFKNRKSAFLMPTYFSLFGLINICPLGEEFENGLEYENAKRLWVELYTVTNGDVLKEGHHFEETKNFCIYKGVLKMCDYGGIGVRQVISHHILALDDLSRRFQK